MSPEVALSGGLARRTNSVAIGGTADMGSGHGQIASGDFDPSATSTGSKSRSAARPARSSFFTVVPVWFGFVGSVP